jgi:hypothetical protein
MERSVSVAIRTRKEGEGTESICAGDGWDGTGALGLEESSRYKLGPSLIGQ